VQLDTVLLVILESIVAGGLVKKTVLAAGAMTAAAAVCYPREATDISKYTWTVASDFVTTSYHDWFDCKHSLPS